jgi:hypothetical protein
MNPHTYYLLASYGMLALAVALELLFLRNRRLQARQLVVAARAEQPARRAQVRVGKS